MDIEFLFQENKRLQKQLKDLQSLIKKNDEQLRKAFKFLCKDCEQCNKTGWTYYASAIGDIDEFCNKCVGKWSESWPLI